MKKTIFILIAITFSLINNIKAQIDTYKSEEEGYFCSPKPTAYGIVATDNFASKIYLINDGISKEILALPNCGRYFTVSSDGKFIGFKKFTDTGQQIPAILDINSGKITELYTPSNQCGQVSFSDNGKIVFSVGYKIIVKTDENIETFEIGTYSNITPISSDGNYVIFDKNLETLNLLDLNTGLITEIYFMSDGCIYPKWSPDGTKILFQNRNNQILVWDKNADEIYKIDEGGNVEWNSTGEYIVYQKNFYDIEKLEFYGSDIFISTYDGSISQNITNSTDCSEMAPVFDGLSIIYNTYDERQIISGRLVFGTKITLSKEILIEEKSPLKINYYNTENFHSSKAIKMVNGDVPYVHQKYDAPTGSNGGSACAATSSTMALAYYNRLPKWPVAANNYPDVTGTNHFNDYSGYVLAKYRYNEHYFDAYSSTKNAWGGYAYMWVSPYTSPASGGMKGFQDHHNMTSGSMVWTSSCTVAKTRTEIDGSWPQPICSWITHSGHLTLAVGYVVGQSTIIFNDPWGNKNLGTYPNYSGKGAYYDWPGYNNGYQNLDPDGSHGTVAWTLTARSSEPTYDPLTIQNIYYNHGFYMNNSQNGSTQPYYRHVIDAAGQSGHIWWTGAEGGASSDVCWVTWTPTISQTASYKVEVWIPSAFTDTYSTVAVTSSSYYKIYYNGGNTSVTVNQFANRGTWVDLGTYQFVQGQTGYVRLGDAVLIADDGKKVLFDAVRFTVVPGLQVTSTNITCKGSNDGTASVTVQAGYTSYLWSPGGMTTSSVSNLSPGDYTVTVSPGNLQATITILEASQLLAVTTSSTNPSVAGAADGSITANVSGGVAPFTYSWSPNVSTSNLAQNLVAGTYTVIVTDAYGCVKQATAVLEDPICTSCCVLLDEDFTGLTSNIPPAGWSNIVNAGGYSTYDWRFNNPGGRTISGADFDSQFAILDADFLDGPSPGDGNKANSSLITRAFNCTGRNDVRLKFAHKFVAGVTHQADGKVEVSNDGTTWNVIDTWPNVSDGAVYENYDISAYAANEETVYIKWTYTDRTYWSNYWAIDNVTVYAPPAGTKTISANGGDYANFTEAINAINNCGVGTGGVTFLVASGEEFVEDPPVITATGTATKPVIFIKDGTGTNPVIKSTGTISTTDAAITIAGGDYFTFDGIDIQINSGSDLEYGYYLKNISATDGAQHNTIKNCSITLNKTNTNSVGIFQLIQTTITPSTITGANSYNSYSEILISNAYHGMKLFGYDNLGTGILDTDCSISDCTIFNFGLSTGTIRSAGILAWSITNFDVHDNLIYDGISNSFSYGIYCAGYVTGNIYSNRVYNIFGTDYINAGIRTYESDMNIYLNEVSDIESPIMAGGIEAFGGTVNIYNNFVYDIKTPTADGTYAPSTRGISFRNTSGTQTVFNNTVYIAYNSSNSANVSTCLFIESSTVDSRNNIFENNTNAATGTRATCIYFKTTADMTNLSSNSRNNLFWVGTTSSKYCVAYNAGSSTAYPTLANYVAALTSPREQNGQYSDPPFRSTVNPYDVHINISSAQAVTINNLGIPISSPFSITTDFDGDNRNVSTPDIGADEFTPDTYLCGNYTINNTLATGGTNYNNFTDAINALNNRGISCAVVFNVTSGQVFTENVPSLEITGTSANTITFQKSGTNANPVLKPTGTAADDDFGIHIDGGDYFTFNGIDIQIASGSALEFGYYLTNVTGTDGAQHNTIKNCTITLNNTNQNSSGIYQLIRTDLAPTSSAGSNSFNIYDNITVLNSYHGFKVFGYDVIGQSALYDDGVEVKNCYVNNFGRSAGTVRAVGILTWSQKNLLIHHNTISNGTTNYRTLGIYTAGNVWGNLYNNTVFGIYGTGSQVVGLRSWESEVNIYNNIVNDVNGTTMASGIEIYGGTSDIYNNFIWDIRTPNTETYNYPTARGISNRGGTSNIFNNSVYLDYVSTVATNESAGIFIEGFSGDVAVADIRNNIVVNKVNVTVGTVAAALYKSAEYSTISTNSDNNLYFSGIPSAKNVIFYDENNADQTIAAYKLRTSTYEQNSVSEMPPFTSISGTYNLHLISGTPSLCNSGGQVIGSVTTDIDGELRDVSSPDIGADEYSGGAIWTGVTSNDWNITTNWRPNAIPLISTNVKIPTQPIGSYFPETNSVASKLAVCNNLEIETGAHLWIEAGKYLTVNGTFTQNGEFLLKSSSAGNASLLNSTTNVDADVQLFLSGTQWHYISSPVLNAQSSLFNTNSLYYYDETTTDSWSGGTFSGTQGWTKVTDANLSSFTGYAYYNSSTTITFSGGLHSGTYTSPLLSWTNTTMSDEFEGWHLLGNPYPSAIDWYGGTENGYITLTNLDNTVYYYDDLIDNYRYYNGHTNQGAAGYNGSLNAGSRYIPSLQGFFVHAKANNAQLQITNNARVHDASVYYKVENSGKGENFIVLETSTDKYSDETAIVEINYANLEFDSEYDAYKMFSFNDSVPQIYSISNDIQFAVNTIPEIIENISVPLGFKAGIQGVFKINLKDFNLTTDIYLEDKQTNTMHNLKENPVYTFSHTGGNTTERFILHFSENSTEISENLYFANVYRNDGNIVIETNFDINQKTHIEIFDLTGRQIHSGDYYQNKILIPEVYSGFKLIKIINNSNLYVKKLSIF